MTHIRVRARLTTSIDGPSGKQRNAVVTDLFNNIGEGSTIDLPGIAVGVDPKKFANSPGIPTKIRERQSQIPRHLNQYKWAQDQLKVA